MQFSTAVQGLIDTWLLIFRAWLKLKSNHVLQVYLTVYPWHHLTSAIATSLSLLAMSCHVTFQPCSLSISSVGLFLLAASKRFFVPSHQRSSESWHRRMPRQRKIQGKFLLKMQTRQILLCFNDTSIMQRQIFRCNIFDFESVCLILPAQFRCRKQMSLSIFSARKWVWMGRWDIVAKTSLASDVQFQVQCFLHFPVPFRVSPCISISSRSAPAPASKPKENKNSANRYIGMKKKTHCPREDPTSLCNQWCH